MVYRLLVLVLLGLVGCSTYELQPPEPGDAEWKATTPPPLSSAAQPDDGSLFRRD